MRSLHITAAFSMLKVCVLLATYALAPFNPLQAQIAITPERITIEDGLSQGYIAALAQDREGYIWIGTKNGLNRYDGRDFEIFTNDPSDPYSISDDWTTGILDHGDYLLVIGVRGDLDIYSKKTKRFYHVPEVITRFGRPNSTPKISRDALGQLWIFSGGMQKLVRVILPDGYCEMIDTPGTSSEEVEILEIDLPVANHLGFSEDGRSVLVFTPDQTSHLVDIASGQIRDYSINPAEEDEIVSFRRLSGGEILGYSRYALKIYGNGRPKQVQTEFQINGVIVIPQLGHLWIRTLDEFLLISTDLLDRASIGRKDAIAFLPGFIGLTFEWLTDRSGITYIGTGAYGILKVHPHMLSIRHFFKDTSIYATPFATDDGEILVYNTVPPFGVLYHPGTDPKFEFVTAYLGAANEGMMLQCSQGQYWLLTCEDHEKVCFYSVDTTLQTVTWKAEFGCTSPANFAAMADRSGHLLLACESTLAVYNTRTDDLQLHDMSAVSNGESGYYCMVETASGIYWIGSPIGLIRAQERGGTFEFALYQVAEGNADGLQNNHVSALLRDPVDSLNLWLGTKGGGLQKLDTRTMDWTTFNAKNGLPNNVIYGVLSDDSNQIWMSSNKGIIRLDPATGNITNFVEADGLQSSEFNTFAYTSTPNGQLLFGGIYGLNAFHPDELSINQTTAAPLLTGLEINNIRITARDSTGILDQALEFTSSITLPHGQNNITLHFVSPEFTAPFENRYRYYLQGAEDPWVHETTDNQAAYLNLRPGNYTFFLAASNSDEVWSEAITQLHIEIVPPWYLSNLAYVVYFLLLGLTAWWVVRVRESRMRMRHDIAMKQQETARLRELDQVKSQLYTNITHEFRTPLTVISGIADEMEAAPEHKALIKRNSEQLLDLVNQMLDLRKLESGSMTLHMEQADGIAFLRYVVDAFAALASAKGLSLAFSSNVDELVLDIDRHKWTRVMSNLLSNAIKFTPHGGHVQVHVEHRLMKDSEQLDITVEDSGLGIPESGLVHIFDRFYQVDNSSTRAGEGTGVGLSLVSEMVHLLGGEIQVSSAPGVGTAFCVQLPVSRDAPLVSTDPGPVPVYTGTAAEVPDKDPAPAMTTTADSALPRLLMIEDSPDVATYLVSCLQGMYNLEIARDGRAGIAKAIESVPDIIISDVMMPFADGFEVCNTLKTDARTSHIPIILLTAKADIQSRIEGLKRGADAYIAKPFHKQELLVELQKLIALRKLLQARYQSHDPPEPTDDPGTQLEDAFILRFRDVVEAHLDDADFDVAALCKAMGSSRSQLHRKITALTGMSTAEFQRSIRLHRAKELLLGSDMNVSEIAYEVGFRDPNYFTKAFSAAFGLTPSRFRSEVHT